MDGARQAERPACPAWSGRASLAEAFAVRGWIAAAIDHPEDRFGDQTPEGRFAVWRRAPDLGVALNEASAGAIRKRRRRGAHDRAAAGKKTRARTSMLSRGAASVGVFGSSKAVCAVNRARPSSSESYVLMSSTSPGAMAE